MTVLRIAESKAFSIDMTVVLQIHVYFAVGVKNHARTNSLATGMPAPY